jgi:hypothetical protein
MAGSKRWFKYTTDAGVDMSVNLDESNSEATINGVRLFLARTARHPVMAGVGKRARYVLATTTTSADLGSKVITRKFKIGNPAAIALAQSGEQPLVAVTFPGYPPSNWSTSTYSGEKVRLSPALDAATGDTGLDDGDQGRDQA